VVSPTESTENWVVIKLMFLENISKVIKRSFLPQEQVIDPT
jgi:hypothetical protein